jgi:hypothetical protein
MPLSRAVHDKDFSARILRVPREMAPGGRRRTRQIS